MLKHVFFFLLFPFLTYSAPVCYFIPPDGWECVLPKNPSSPVQIGFLGKGTSDFRPSLNLSTEEVDVSLKEYLKSVREIHESEMNVRWKDLGEFTFRAGKGRLAEITSKSPVGEVKMLQGIFIRDGVAYIMTGAASKEEFADKRITLLSALRSLDLTMDLLSLIGEGSKREELQQTFKKFETLATADEREKEWKRLQKIVLEEHASLGSYWHFLVLKEGHAKIFPKNSEF